MNEESSKKFNRFLEHVSNKKKTIVIILFIIFIIGIILYKTNLMDNIITFFDYKNKLESEVKNEFSDIKKIEFLDYDFKKINVYMNNNFNHSLNYQEKEECICNITKVINNIVKEYGEKNTKNTDELTNNEEDTEIYIFCNNDKYQYNKYFIKNNEVINSVAEDLIIQNNLSNNEKLCDYIRNDAKKSELKDISKINNVDERLKELYYIYGKNKFDDGKLDEASESFEKIKDFKDANNYIKNINNYKEIQGTWKAEDEKYFLVVDGLELTYNEITKRDTKRHSQYSVFFKNSKYCNNLYITDINLEDNSIKLSNKTFKINFQDKFIVDEQNRIYKFISSTPLEYPKVGMTKSEVENSMLGEPGGIMNEGGRGGLMNSYNEDKWPETWYYESDTTITQITFKNYVVDEIKYFDKYQK